MSQHTNRIDDDEARALKRELGHITKHDAMGRALAYIAQLEADNALLKRMAEFALNIPNLSDDELQQVIQNCRSAIEKKAA